MQVKDIMSCSVISIAPEESAAVAARLLSRHNIGALPVCSPDGRLLGMITDRDIVLRCVAAQKDPARTRVSTLMTRRVVRVQAEDSAESAAACMAHEQVRRLPVTQDNRLVGFLSLSDFANAACPVEVGAAFHEICQNLQRR